LVLGELKSVLSIIPLQPSDRTTTECTFTIPEHQMSIRLHEPHFSRTGHEFTWAKSIAAPESAAYLLSGLPESIHRTKSVPLPRFVSQPKTDERNQNDR
jgi:hypothetical protein